jgi:hypothetical protein
MKFQIVQHVEPEEPRRAIKLAPDEDGEPAIYAQGDSGAWHTLAFFASDGSMVRVWVSVSAQLDLPDLTFDGDRISE